jgi:hypothetical protein
MILRLPAQVLTAILPICLAPAWQIEAGPKTVGRTFVAAVRSGNIERRLAMLHPRTRSCMASETDPYFAWIFSRQMKYVIEEGKVAVRAQPLAESWQPGMADYPVRPTHAVQVEFETRPGSSTTVVLLVVEEGGRWYEILPCPTTEAVAQMKKAAEERAAQEDQALRAAADLSADRKREIAALLKAGRRVEAIQKAGAAGYDLAVARRLIDLLETRAGLRPAPLFEIDSRKLAPKADRPDSQAAMDISIREIERRPRVSVLSIETRAAGSSVGSSFFLLCSIRQLADLRGGYRYIAKIESHGIKSRMVIGFLESPEEKLDVLGPEFRGIQSSRDIIDLEQFAPICAQMR